MTEYSQRLKDLNANLVLMEDTLFRCLRYVPEAALVRMTADMGEGTVRTWVTLHDGSEHLVTEWGLSDEPPF